MIDSSSIQTDDSPSLETLMFKAGLISADDLGELVRDAVVAQRPVAALAVERNLVTPRALETLLAQTRGEDEPAPLDGPVNGSVNGTDHGHAVPVPAAEPAPEPVAAEPDPEPEPVPVPVLPLAPVSAPAPEPAPVVEPPPAAAADPEPEVVPAPEAAAAAYDVVVRLTTGDAVHAGAAPTRGGAEQLARSTAERFRAAGEWPLVGGRCLRPDLVLSVDLVRRLED